jgi:sortase A
VLAWILLAAGLFLMLVGMREVGTAYFSQQQAAAVYAASKPDNATHETMPEGFIARLEIPRLNAIWFVVDGRIPENETLRRGPGVVPGSAEIGARGNCIIAGHRDLHFRVLKDVHVGDKILLATGSEVRTYRISSTQIVKQTNVKALAASNAEDRLTLVTCYPFYYVGHAPNRFIVKAAIQK